MKYVICTQGRARSSVLMKYLKQLGAGFPETWTNTWFSQERDFNDYEALCKFVAIHRIDDHSCMRIHWGDLDKICRTHNVKAIDFFQKCLPDAKYIYFTREKLLHTTEVLYYWATQAFDEEPMGIPTNDIRKRLLQSSIQEACWEEFFRRNGIIPFRTSCEELLCETEGTCRAVMEYLEIPYPENVVLEDASYMLKLNTETAKEWYNTMIRKHITTIEGEV